MQWDNKDDMVWPEDEPWFYLMTPETETSGKWTTVLNPSKPKGVLTLVSWISGNDAVEAEKHTDDKILDDVMKNLQDMFPDITRPDRVYISRWGQEPNVRVTYSYKIVGRDRGDDSRYLQQNVGRLYFWRGNNTGVVCNCGGSLEDWSGGCRGNGRSTT